MSSRSPSPVPPAGSRRRPQSAPSPQPWQPRLSNYPRLRIERALARPGRHWHGTVMSDPTGWSWRLRPQRRSPGLTQARQTRRSTGCSTAHSGAPCPCAANL